MADLNNTPNENEELNNNVDLVPEDTTPADVTTVVTDEQPEHKVLFGIVVGIACLTVVGIPALIWITLKQRKKLKQYEEQFGKLPEESKDKKDDAKAAPTEGDEKKSETK